MKVRQSDVLVFFRGTGSLIYKKISACYRYEASVSLHDDVQDPGHAANYLVYIVPSVRHVIMRSKTKFNIPSPG